MPVRIYDISKKLGLENKEILAKAKSLGIAAAKVPSSSLDKISAEYLEEQLCIDHPELAAKLAPPPPPAPKAAPSEPIVVIKTPPPEPPKPEVKEEPPPVVEAPKPPPPPPKPAGPKVGEKVGFIQLPTRPPPSHWRQGRFGQTSAVASKHARKKRNPTGSPSNRRSSIGAAIARTPPNPPRRSPNLSRPRPAKSSSSNHRLSCANSPRNSSRSRSRSSPI